MSAVVDLSGQLAHADEVGRTGNPAFNLTQAKTANSSEHTNQANQSAQASGELPFTVLHEELDKVDQVAKAQGVQVVTD